MIFGSPADVLWNSCLSLNRYVSNQLFSESVQWSFPEILHGNRNLKTKKSDKSWSRKFLLALKLTKRRKDFYTFYEMLLLFAGSNLKWNTWQLSVFLCKAHICETSGSPVIGKNALTQSDCGNLWSSISLELGYQFLLFFA